MNEINPIIEEFEECHLSAYPDDVGIPTIGRGNTTYPDGTKVKLGDEITQDQADAYYFHYINEVVHKEYKFPKWLGQNQKWALEALLFNIDIGSFKRSKLRKAIESKEIKGIDKEWDWVSCGGKPARGLARRRALERYFFMKDRV